MIVHFGLNLLVDVIGREKKVERKLIAEVGGEVEG